jgi:transposase-like protein
MKNRCPNFNCSSHTLCDPKLRPIVRNGFFYRKSDSKKIRKYFCRICKSYFSTVSLSPFRYQKKRRVNVIFRRLYNSGISQRRFALVMGINPKTVARRLRLFSELSQIKHEKYLNTHYKNKPLSEIQFDDLETSIHTKCKPVSVTLAVDPKTRKILKFKVSQMPAKGHLAEISRRKYGRRTDERPIGWDEFMRELTPYVESKATWTSDENPHYPFYLKRHHPEAIHKRVKGGRGAITGQAELKKLRFDPLFSLNHTCAMLRANINRLFRKTWCTSKTVQGLTDHLWMYVVYHNTVLTEPVRN